MAQSSRVSGHTSSFQPKTVSHFFLKNQYELTCMGILQKLLREQDCETLVVNGVEDHIRHALFARERIPLRKLRKRLNEHHQVG